MTSLSETSLLAGAAGAGDTGYTINKSLRFEDSAEHILHRRVDTTWQNKFTISFWVKRNNLGLYNYIITWRDKRGSGYPFGEIKFRNDDKLEYFDYGTSIDTNYPIYAVTNRVFRDPSAWYHIVMAINYADFDAGDKRRFKMSVNGVRDTDFGTFTLSNQAAQSGASGAGANYIQIGRLYATTNYNCEAYLAEFNFIDGYDYGPEYFGEFDSNGIWIPKEYSETYSNQSFYLSFANGSDIGNDDSGNSKDFTAVGLAAADVVNDTPTNNHGTFNGLEASLRYTTTLSEGNKKINFASGSSGWSGTRLGLFRSNGKAYAEFKVNQAYSHVNGDGITIFVANDSSDSNSPVTAGGGTGSAKLEAAYNAIDGSIYDGTSSQGTGTTWNSVNAVIGVYIDFDNGKGWFSKDGTVQTVNGTPNVNNGTNAHFTFTANTPLTVGAGGVHFGTPGIVSLQNHEDEWDTAPGGSYTPFSTLAEGEA